MVKDMPFQFLFWIGFLIVIFSIVLRKNSLLLTGMILLFLSLIASFNIEKILKRNLYMVLGVFSLILFVLSYLDKNIPAVITSLLIFIASLGLYSIGVKKQEYPHHKVIQHLKHKNIEHKINQKPHKKNFNISKMIKNVILSPLIWAIFSLISLIGAIILLDKKALYLGLGLSIITSSLSGYQARKLVKRKEKKKQNEVSILSPILLAAVTSALLIIGITKQESRILYFGLGLAIVTLVIMIFKIIKLIKNKGNAELDKRTIKIPDRLRQMKNLAKESQSQYETDLDKLCRILEKYKTIKISEIVKTFNIDQKKAEEWSKILQEHELAEIHYPAIGEAELKCKK